MYKIKKFDESAENVHKILKILSIFCAIIIIPIIIYNIVLMVKSMINPNKIPSFLGMKSLVIISESMEPTIMPNDAIFVKTLDGSIKLLEIQFSGKKRVLVKDYLRGNSIKVGEILK